MKNNPATRDLLELNLAILFISTSGVLGRYIALPPVVSTWWRCILAAVILLIFCRFKKMSLIIKKKDIIPLLLSSVFLAGHWITYFYSLQLSGVAIAMLSLFTFPVFTAFLEPIFYNTKLTVAHFGLVMLVLIGIYLLVPDINLENTNTIGLLFGLASAVSYTIRNLILKKRIANYSGSSIMFYQLIVITVLLIPYFLYEPLNPEGFWFPIISLAILTTAIGHTLFVLSLKNFSVTTASIISSSQPIYGIILGVIFLGEIPSSRTIIGGILILATVIIESISSGNSKK